MYISEKNYLTIAVSLLVIMMFGGISLNSTLAYEFDNTGYTEADGDGINLFTWQYFINYNLSNGWYLVSTPIITANWENTGDEWTIPFGGGIGKILRIGKQPINTSVQAY